MRKIYFLLLMVLFIGTIYGQSGDILYFCERYDQDLGEVGISDRFTTGSLTVMAKLASSIYYTSITIQLDKFNPRANKFEYYKDFSFSTDSDMTYIYFNDIDFGEPGFYRVFLLSPSKDTIASGIVEIIRDERQQQKY